MKYKIPEVMLTEFGRRGIRVGFLYLTKTGFSKSIMDAVRPLRELLREHNIHDYDCQPQGQQYKACVPARFITEDDCFEISASLYRPVTKQGDPRIWFNGLKRYVGPDSILAVIPANGILYVMNISSPQLRTAVALGCFPARVLDEIADVPDAAFIDLLKRLKSISLMGYVPTVVKGDTGVGMTLEYLLGISANSSRLPDYRGIEVKAARSKGKGSAKNRDSLFSQVPDWGASPIGSAGGLLREYGYFRNERLQLYCTVAASRPNSQGLILEGAQEDDLLTMYGTAPNYRSQLLSWEMPVLRERLKQKHAETVWVKADVIVADGVERFQYRSLVHTKSPNTDLLGDLINQDVITLDLTLSDKGGRIRDHGYLFKLRPDSRSMLFPDPTEYELIDLP